MNLPQKPKRYKILGSLNDWLMDLWYYARSLRVISGANVSRHVTTIGTVVESGGKKKTNVGTTYLQYRGQWSYGREYKKNDIVIQKNGWGMTGTFAVVRDSAGNETNQPVDLGDTSVPSYNYYGTFICIKNHTADSANRPKEWNLVSETSSGDGDCWRTIGQQAFLWFQVGGWTETKAGWSSSIDPTKGPVTITPAGLTMPGISITSASQPGQTSGTGTGNGRITVSGFDESGAETVNKVILDATECVSSDGTPRVVKVREIQVCDDEGVKKYMLVLASPVYSLST